MSMSLERVKVADIKPLVDEHGYMFVSRDYSLPANKKYVKELAESFGPSGEPDEPVKLIRDGDVFRIKAGNTRVRAMQELGTKECWAVIDDEDSVQSVVETVVRTDKKKKYEDVELSGFVQQLMYFGDDDYVSSVAQIDAEKAKMVRSARGSVGEIAGQMTIDQLLLAYEFEGDEEAIKQIVNAPAGRLESIGEELRRRRDLAVAEAAFKQKAADAGVSIVDNVSGKRYIRRCVSADDLVADYMAARVDYTDVVAKLSKYWTSVTVDFYGVPLKSESETAEEAEKRRLMEEYTDIATRIDDACVNWVAELLSGDDACETVGSLANLNEACRKAVLGGWQAAQIAKVFPRVVDEDGCLFMFGSGYQMLRERLAARIEWMVDDFGDQVPYWVLEELDDAVKWIDLHIADGFECDEEMSGFLDMIKEKTAELDAEDPEVDKDERA